LLWHLIELWQDKLGHKAMQTRTGKFATLVNSVFDALNWGDDHGSRIQRVLKRYRKNQLARAPKPNPGG
jgi:hypothetical protein